MVWIVDEKEVFAVNENLKINIKKVDNKSVVIVDNFYKNPDLVRELILKSPATSWRKARTNFPGVRSILALDLSPLRNAVNSISEKVYQTQVFDIEYFISNIFIQNDNNLGFGAIPHVDPYYLSGIVYLNTDEEARGGTALFKNKKTQLKDMSQDFLKPEKVFRKEFIIDSDSDWELMDIVDMKYNRFVLYNSNIFHSTYIKPEWFKDYPRINQVFFISQVIKNDSVIFREMQYPKIELEDGYVRVSSPQNNYALIENIPPELVYDFLYLANGNKFIDIINTLAKKYDLRNKENLVHFKNMINEFMINYLIKSINN